MLAKLSKFVVLTAGLAACGGSKAAPKNASLETSIPAVDPTLCDTTGKNVVTFDLNHDNKPDEWILYKTEDEGGTKVEFMTCKQIDFDHDGRKDYVVAYNRKGNPIYEKDDFDFDGKWDDSKVFDPKTGQVAEVERDERVRRQLRHQRHLRQHRSARGLGPRSQPRWQGRYVGAVQRRCADRDPLR